MKFVSYKHKSRQRLGIYQNNKIFDLKDTATQIGLMLPAKMKKFLKNFNGNFLLAKKVEEAISADLIKDHLDENDVQLLAPVPKPTSCRDGYAFRQHVATARRNRGVEMIPEFDQFPIFYFTNHNAVIGPGDVLVEEDHLKGLDFELEAAVVIGNEGKNISSKDADYYIAGYMIMNDFSARVLQMDEMKLNLGPAKGKDFATSLGPWLVTPDELEPYKFSTQFGNKYNLKMSAWHNGVQISDGNMKDMDWTFAEIIERASYGVTLYPGDVIGSGTCGTGCYLELNGTHSLEAKAKGETFTPVWFKAGDTVELEITGLGRLINKFVISPNSYSILAKKKV